MSPLQSCNCARSRFLALALRSTRPLSVSRRLDSTRNDRESAHTSEADGLQRLKESQTSSQTPLKPINTSHIPWYLQINSQIPVRTTPAHILERQQLPPVPSNSPPILESLLQYMSTDLGLDYLTLIDLRKLDPPPALGGNLIMVIGTARSEKHLHVSADRFCRHLRSQHKLRPDADGLLGRNELKIKVRRRMKKLKQMADRGMNDLSEIDDGMKTGWICVHVTGIQPAESAVKESPRPEFVGFDDAADTVTLTAHMFTEQKREEMKLEDLWTTYLGRFELKMEEQAKLEFQDDVYESQFEENSLQGERKG